MEINRNLLKLIEDSDLTLYESYGESYFKLKNDIRIYHANSSYYLKLRGITKPVDKELWDLLKMHATNRNNNMLRIYGL